jgi:type IV pilus assembly protein PilB
VAQRLVRRICPHCRIEVDDVPPPTLIEMGLAPDLAESLQLFEGEGCNVCLGTGYKGRVGLYEVMEISEDIGDFIRNGATGSQIRRKAIEEGMATLRMSGIEKIQDGVTTFEEVLHATSLGSPA